MRFWQLSFYEYCLKFGFKILPAVILPFQFFFIFEKKNDSFCRKVPPYLSAAENPAASRVRQIVRNLNKLNKKGAINYERKSQKHPSNRRIHADRADCHGRDVRCLNRTSSAGNSKVTRRRTIQSTNEPKNLQSFGFFISHELHE
jgi:hypothetical protein